MLGTLSQAYLIFATQPLADSTHFVSLEIGGDKLATLNLTSLILVTRFLQSCERSEAEQDAL